MIVMQRAISDRENIRKTCSAMRIHRNAVVALGARQEQWLDSWDYPHAYNHQIGGNHFAIRQTDSGYPRLAFDRRCTGIEPDIDAVGAVFYFEKFGQRRCCDAREHSVHSFQNDDFLSEFREYCCRL